MGQGADEDEPVPGNDQHGISIFTPDDDEKKAKNKKEKKQKKSEQRANRTASRLDSILPGLDHDEELEDHVLQSAGRSPPEFTPVVS